MINSVRQVQRSSGIDKVHAIVGGWHLVGARASRVAETIDAFKEIDPDYILPMHCAGFDTMAQLRRELPERLLLPSTGDPRSVRSLVWSENSLPSRVGPSFHAAVVPARV